MTGRGHLRMRLTAPKIVSPLVTLAFFIVFLAVTGCGGDRGESSAAATSLQDTGEDGGSDSAAAASETRVPVKAVSVRTENLSLTVAATGRTAALHQSRVRAPYASRIMSLRVADGDRVKRGQIVAVVVSKNSEAALEGAKQMLAAARTAATKADAERALEIAQSSLVQQSLLAPASGVVVSHAAEAGDYVDESEVLVTIAETDTVFFDAQVAQSDVDKVHQGQAAQIDLPAVNGKAIAAVVHRVLPLASSQSFIAPVRLDFSPPRPDLGLGLFGTAHIVVARHPDAIVVPESSVLRDDLTGVTRVAVIGPQNLAHWLTVETGIRAGDEIEVVRPTIAPGTRVISDGQVGLPEGAQVTVQQ